MGQSPADRQEPGRSGIDQATKVALASGNRPVQSTGLHSESLPDLLRFPTRLLEKRGQKCDRSDGLDRPERYRNYVQAVLM